MPTTYTPTATALTTITLPADGDPRTAASVNGPMSALANGIAYLTAHLPILALVENIGTGPGGGNSSASFLAPSDSVAAIIEMVGGGGGGGTGAGSGVTLLTGSAGGGGGGGARRIVSVIPIVGGDTYSSFVSAPAAAGYDGGDSILYHGAVEIARARGGARGLDGQLGIYAAYHYNGSGVADTTDTYYGYTPGGGSAAPTNGAPGGSGYALSYFIPSEYWGINLPRHPQQGGFGLNYWAGLTGSHTTWFGSGSSSPEGQPGGSVGATGAKFGTTTMGGGPGGGGGAGPYGAGADGGAGSAGVSTGTPSAPGSGNSALAGTGAGGGGGGGAGSTDSGSTPASGAVGGQGGSGRVRVWFLRKA